MKKPKRYFLDDRNQRAQMSECAIGFYVSVDDYAELKEECEILKRHNVDLCKINKELGDVARATEFKRVQLDQLLENIDLAVGDGCEGINYDELRRLMIFWSEIE